MSKHKIEGDLFAFWTENFVAETKRFTLVAQFDAQIGENRSQ